MPMVRGVPHPLSIDSLPTDILREILDHIDPEYSDFSSLMKFWKPTFTIGHRAPQDVLADIRNFRLVCRRFGEIGAQYLFRSIAHRYNNNSFDRLEQLADHPVLAKHVKKFVYLMPYFYVEGTKDFNAFKKDFKMQIGPYTDAYKIVIDEQQHLKDSGYDLTILKKAMKSFTSLQQIQILSVLGEKESQILQMAEDSADQWEYVDCQWIPACQHAVETIIQALNYGRPPVYSFVSPRLSPQSLLGVSPQVQELGLSTWSQLTYLKLNFHHSSDRNWYKTQLENRILLLAPFFKDLFRSAQNLAELHIGFFPSSPLQLRLQEVFHGTCWTKMRILGIEAWRLTSAEIIEMIQQHGRTLRGLRIANVVLREGSSWKDIVIFVQSLNLEWLSLDEIAYENDFDSRHGYPSGMGGIMNIQPQDDDGNEDQEQIPDNDDNDFDMGFNILLDGSTSTHAGHIGLDGPAGTSADALLAYAHDPGLTTAPSSSSQGDVDNNTEPTDEGEIPSRLAAMGLLAVGNVTSRFDALLDDYSNDLEDNGVTVSEVQMVHWERWAVGRDVYTGRKYLRPL